MKKIFFFTILSLFLYISSAQAEEKNNPPEIKEIDLPAPVPKTIPITALNFICSSDTLKYSKIILDSMYDFNKQKILFNLPIREEIEIITYELDDNIPENKISSKNIEKYQTILSNMGSNYLILGKIILISTPGTPEEPKNSISGTQAYLFSGKENKFIYQTEEKISPEDNLDEAFKSAGKNILGKISLFLTEQMPKISQLKAVPGTKKISLFWETSLDKAKYIIYRSTYDNGPLKIMGKSLTPGFIDTKIKPGLEYFYQIKGTINEIPGEISEKVISFSPIEIKGLNPDKIIKKKNKGRPFLLKSDSEKADLNLLKKYYINQVKLSLIIFTGKYYVQKGTVLVLNDFDNLQIDEQNKIIFLTKTDKYLIKFHSEKLFRLKKEIEANPKTSKNLLKRLLKNAIFYCIDTQENTKLLLKDKGHIYLPTFEALGATTEYYKNYKNWQTNSIMLGTSNKELKQKMKEIFEKHQNEKEMGW